MDPLGRHNLEKSSKEEIFAEAKRIVDARVGPRPLS